MTNVRVLVVDDSAVARGMLGEFIDGTPGLEVAGYARDGLQAAAMLKGLRPDVVTLDIEMPRMGGLRFLESVLPADPVPVVVISSLSRPGCDVTLTALGLGAVDFITKPGPQAARDMEGYGRLVAAKILAASRANRAVIRAAAAGVPDAPVAHTAGLHGMEGEPGGAGGHATLLAIGASAGGPRALRDLFSVLAGGLPPIVVAQHMPASFTYAFAARLDAGSRVRVREARDGDTLMRGHAYVAPGGAQLHVERGQAGLVARVDAGNASMQHRPSVDLLFSTAARAAGAGALAAVLTGMGDDGSIGALAIRAAGGRVIAQDQASSTIFGMPGAVARVMQPDAVAPLSQIADLLAAWSVQPLAARGTNP